MTDDAVSVGTIVVKLMPCELLECDLSVKMSCVFDESGGNDKLFFALKQAVKTKLFECLLDVLRTASHHKPSSQLAS